jgi:mRNA interferase HigB
LQIVARKTIKEFWEISSYKDSEQPLKSWYSIVKKADWATPQDVKDDFGNASFIAGNRVVFNIAGNKYRLIVKFHYNTRIGYIRFIGTHKEYDQIEAESI